MKTLFFPLLLILQFSDASEIDFTKTQPIGALFKQIKGLENILNFFGEKMDRKIDDTIPPTLSFSKYDEEFPTFVVNLKKSENSGNPMPVTFNQIEYNLRNQYGWNEDTILIGLDGLILKE